MALASNTLPSSIDIPARTAWGEARGEGMEGMHAVLNVIQNRVRSPGWWGNSLVSVCLRNYQFSCWNVGDPNRMQLLRVTTDDPQFREAVALARQAMTGDLPDITNGADSYYAVGTGVPAWAVNREPVAIIGRHWFYTVGLDGKAGLATGGIS